MIDLEKRNFSTFLIKNEAAQRRKQKKENKGESIKKRPSSCVLNNSIILDNNSRSVIGNTHLVKCTYEWTADFRE